MERPGFAASFRLKSWVGGDKDGGNEGGMAAMGGGMAIGGGLSLGAGQEDAEGHH